jgi:hypothetical protein
MARIKVESFGELRLKAMDDASYETLAITAANNLGGNAKNLSDAMAWLEAAAMEIDEEGEDGEALTIEEVNHLADLLSTRGGA